MKPNWSNVAIWVGAGMLVASMLACAGGGPAPTSPASTSTSTATGGIQDLGDPCQLLTKAVADKLFGETSDPGKTDIGADTARCLYSGTGGNTLTVRVYYEDGPAKDSSAYTSVRTSDTEPVSGLGDDAYYNTGAWLLAVAKGHWMLTVHAFVGGNNQGLDTLKPLAQTAVSRLPG